MGAHTFTVTSTNPDLAKAYNELVRESRHESGNNPYNGTISTTSGYRVVSAAPVSATAAELLMVRRIEKLSKWSDCEVVAVGTPTKTRTRKVSFNVTRRPDRPEETLRVSAADVAAALGVAEGDIESFTVTESSPKYKVTVTKAGPARRVWVTANGHQFATRTEALEAAKRTVEQSDWIDPSRKVVTYLQPTRSVSVSERIVREPEATVVRTLVSWKVKVDAVVADSGERQFDHWLFYGWAAS